MAEQTHKAKLHYLMRQGPLPGSLWRDRGGEVYIVVTLSLSPADFSLHVVCRDAEGLTWLQSLSEWSRDFKPYAPPAPLTEEARP